MSMSTTPRSPVSPVSTAFETHRGGESTPRRRAPPLPAVKGTLAGIESPRRERELYSPAASTFRATASPAPSAQASEAGDASVSTIIAPSNSVAEELERERERAPVLVFRSDPRLRTCFDGLPEGAGEVKAKFGL